MDLDRTADAPVDLYVNGMRFARGQLLVTDDGEWAVSLDGLESQGLRMLDLARSAQAEPRELVEPAAEVVESDAESFDTESEEKREDRDQTSTPDPETPEVTQSEVEGA